jgi:hypothetical protein
MHNCGDGKSKHIPALINQAPRHEDVRVNGGAAPPFLTSALGGGEWSASSSGLFIPGKIASGTDWRGDWAGPRVGLDAAERDKSFAPAGKRTPAIQLVNLGHNGVFV